MRTAPESEQNYRRDTHGLPWVAASRHRRQPADKARHTSNTR